MQATPRPLAVVTGASSGIGRELAVQFASNGFDVVAAADTGEIAELPSRLAGTGAEVTPVQADLRTEEGVRTVAERARATGRPVDVLALNAGIGEGGAFATETDLERELAIVDVNVRSTVHLAKLLVPAMVQREQGRVLFTSSIASTMPGTYEAVYNASKSFVQSFALALRAELHETGVTVTTLMPGPTDTKFFYRAGLRGTRLGEGPKDDPADVARQAFDAVMGGRERVVAASLMTKAQAAMSRLLPDRAKASLHGWMAKQRSRPSRRHQPA